MAGQRTALPEPPRVAIRERRLGNGLTVVSSPSRASPTVSIQVWYRVGGRDDPPGRSGFAHLFEHLMFKATKNLAAEQFDRLTEDVGGVNNAFTSADVTAYHEVVPSNHLETLLWAEAERMANLRVEAGTFASERAVVQEEYRQSVLAAPYGRFANAVRTRPYLAHPYRRGTIGSIEDLDRATLDDVIAFHARHYRPRNAVLVVTGDFDPPELDRWVDRHFGAIADGGPTHADTPFPPTEPPWPAERLERLTGPSVPLPAVALAWRAPPVGDADLPALRIAAALLASGDASRLHQALVYRGRIARQAGFDVDARAGPGLIVATAIVAGGAAALGPARRALEAEVRALAGTRPATAAELDRVRTQLVTATLATRQTPAGLGMALGEAAAVEGRAERVNEDLGELMRVDAAAVARVLRRHVVDRPRMVLEYRQETAATKGGAP
jgi:zinc protease